MKRALKKDETKNKIPSFSLLGQMLKYWPDNPQTKGKKKKQMIKYCCFIWTQGPVLKLAIFWPKFGSDEDWVCQLVIGYVNDKVLGVRKKLSMSFVGDKDPWFSFP
jgi:hypothetical protein